ncbi:MAG: class A beta-lactamase, subclass A2 [Ignavibacteriaceae bacterium]|jgi:beta-lactamase class A
MKYLHVPYLFILFASFFIATTGFSQNDSLRAKIEKISVSAKGIVGVAVIGIEKLDTMSFNGNKKFPMQSVYKFPLALAVLHQVDKGKFSLKQLITLKKEDLLPNTWSPLRDKYPGGNVKITLDELIAVTVSRSDNNGCDILFRLIGGPKIVNKYIHDLGIKEIAITTTEAEMHKDWETQYTNWCSPRAMGKLLSMFYQGKILSKESSKYLYEVMVKTTTASKKLKGLLPEGTIVAHKSGLSGSNEKGILAASNDVGIVTLPDGNHFVIAVFVSNSTADESSCDTVIAGIAKIVWDWNLNH